MMMISITRLDEREEGEKKKLRKKEQYRLNNQQVDTPFTFYPILLFQAVYMMHTLSFDYDIHSIINIIKC
jgi:hypothetical protein